MAELTLTLIGGPTVLIETGGLRLLTDPTFDPAGGDYDLGPVTLHKTTGPAQPAGSLGHLDTVLLSHEQHSDNLDQTGRALLDTVPQVLTTPQSAANLGPNAVGLQPWETRQLTAPDGRTLIITATPGRHGPEGAELYSGEVTGFVLTWADEPRPALYFSGDTVWYDGVAAVARRFDVGVALLNMGAARLDLIGPVNLTMNAEGAVETARAFGSATLIPAHVDGWAHFSESREAANRVLAAAGLTNRLRWLEPGVPMLIEY
jgi:L-ascorbate metabolism protein UlaG (beta-lactamase superfamily)